MVMRVLFLSKSRCFGYVQLASRCWKDRIEEVRFYGEQEVNGHRKNAGDDPDAFRLFYECPFVWH